MLRWLALLKPLINDYVATYGAEFNYYIKETELGWQWYTNFLNAQQQIAA